MNINIKNSHAFLIAFVIGFALIVLGLSLTFNAKTANASAPAGVATTLATTTTANVGPQNNVFVIGTTTRETARGCAARVITTQGQPIMLSFGSLSSTSLSTSVGHLQLASTTVAYDGGLYGCGYWTARGLYASSTITVSELQ